MTSSFDFLFSPVYVLSKLVAVFLFDLLLKGVLIKTKNELERFRLFEWTVCSIANGLIIDARQVVTHAFSIKTKESSSENLFYFKIQMSCERVDLCMLAFSLL